MSVLGAHPVAFVRAFERSAPRIPALNRLVFRAFLINVFFLYYETRFIPGTVHTWLMAVGLILTLPMFVNKYGRSGVRLPLDYFLVLMLIALIVAGFFANFPTTMWRDFQAYVLMLATYVYVRENMTPTDAELEFVYGLLRVFLVVNGALEFAQLLTGGFFPARLIAAGDPPLAIASGVSDGATKNGMLISFALSFVYARFLLRNLKFSLVDGAVLGMGAVSLVAAASRAGLASFGAVVVLGGLFVFAASLWRRDYRMSIASIASFALLVFAAVVWLGRSGLSVEMLFDYRDPGAGRYGVDVVMYKLSNFSDSSTYERFGTVSYFVKQFMQSPLHFFSVGFGTGSFESMYGLNVHNSYLEMLFTFGLVGFVCVFLLVGYVSVRALSIPNAVRIVPVLFSLASVAVFMLAHDIIRGRIFWVALGIAAAFAYAPHKSNADE